MTRRGAIAGAGLCALLLPGCLGSSLMPTGGGQKGVLLNDSPRDNGLFGSRTTARIPQPDPTPQSRRTESSSTVVRHDLSPSTGQLMGRRMFSPAPVPRVMNPREVAVYPKLVPPPEVRPVARVPVQPEPARIPFASEPARLPDPQIEQVTERPRVIDSNNGTQPIGTDWDKISRALAHGKVEPAKQPSPLTGSPPATLDMPIKSAPSSNGNSLKPSDSPQPGPIRASDNPPLALPDLGNASNAVPLATPQPEPVLKNAASTSESPLLLAVRAYMAKRPDEALEYLKQYDAANQEVLLYLMPLLARLGEGSLAAMPPEEMAAFVDRLHGATGVMRAKAALRLDTVCFCRRVHNYGKYEPLDPKAVFQPGEPMQLYAEVRNFTWEQERPAAQPGSSGTSYKMLLQNALEVRDALGKVVWRADLPKSDTRHALPTDYYLVYSFAMPESLPAGTYTLTVQVTDKPTGRLVSRAVEFRLGNR